MILAACMAAGYTYIQGKKRRIETLVNLCEALELMAGELDMRITPLPELCRLLGEKARGEASAFFKMLSKSLKRLGATEFSQLWREAAESSLKALSGEEQREIERLGKVLGRYALDEQLSAIKACRAALRTGTEQARASYPGERRLGLGLPAAAGILLIITLI